MARCAFTIVRYESTSPPNGVIELHISVKPPAETIRKRYSFAISTVLDIVVPTLRPLYLGWRFWDEWIRERVCKVAPEIIFEGGDSQVSGL
jgi:hypothetical protein